jgi:hypothetical protein
MKLITLLITYLVREIVSYLLSNLLIVQLLSCLSSVFTHVQSSFCLIVWQMNYSLGHKKCVDCNIISPINS